MPEESRDRPQVHIAVFYYCGEYYPRLCIGHFDGSRINDDHLIVHSWSKKRQGETLKHTFLRIRASLLKKAAEKGETVGKICIAVEELESSLDK